MDYTFRLLRWAVVASIALGLVGCGGGANDPGAPASTYSVGGTLGGLGTGKTVVLQNNGTQTLSVPAAGPFTFTPPLANGANYAVTVQTHPVGQFCSVTNGSGTVNGANVTTVSVACVDVPPGTYTVGGNVTGLAAGKVVALRQGADTLNVSMSGPFVFAAHYSSGTNYAVQVQTQPAGQTCTVTNGSGTINGANITNVSVSCSNIPPSMYTVGGTVTGLGSGKTFQLKNGSETLTVNAPGAFTFATTYPNGTAYSVTLATSPAGQTCTVNAGSGTINGANITNVSVSCSNIPPSMYTVGGTVTDLSSGKTFQLKNGSETLTVNAPGAFTFATTYPNGTAYSVTLATSPAGQTCTVTNGSGTINGANVTNVSVTCSASVVGNALSQCGQIARNMAPFNVGQSSFDTTDMVRNTVSAPQPIVGGVSLFTPDVATQPLMRCGYVDPTAAPYNADPSGNTDSTAAFTSALDFARRNFLAVYVPSGTYKITDTVECVERSTLRTTGTLVADRQGACILVGSHTGTRPKFVLANSAPGFGNAANPKPMFYFWGIGNSGDFATRNDDPAATYNHGAENIDFDLGNNNAGAAALNFSCAQGCFMHDVNIDATGAFAGVLGILASGGSMVNLKITGGQYGIYADQSSARRPVPTLTAITLLDQTKSAIVQGNDTNETLVLVGTRIRLASGATGPAIKVVAEAANTGLITIVDSQIEFATPSAANVAVDTTRGSHMSNVYIRGAGVAVKGASAASTEPAPAGVADWSWFQSLTISVKPPSKNIDNVPVQIEMPLYLNGQRLTQTSERTLGPNGATPPTDLQSRHGWTAAFPWPETANAVNVKRPPYNAVGDGVADDTAALQAAINASDAVFLPKGYYRVSATLQLRPNTKLLGVARTLSVIVAANAGMFTSVANPQPIVATANNADAQTVFSNIGVYVPVSMAGAYAVLWRVGDRSVWRNTEARLFHTYGHSGPNSNQAARSAPLVQVTGPNAGGRWYAFEEGILVPAGSKSYRMLRVSGTQLPLRFYHLNPEHKDNADAYISIENSQNVTVFGYKSEDDKAANTQSPPLLMSGSSQVNIFGAGGYVLPDPDDSTALPPALYRINNSNDFRLVSLIDRLSPGSNTPHTITVTEQPSVGGPVHTMLLDRPISYARNPSLWHTVVPPRRGP